MVSLRPPLDFHPSLRQFQLELEQSVRAVMALNQRRMVLPLHRGNPRSWLPVDDALYGKGKTGVDWVEEAKKVQQKLGAPVPEQLEHWENTFHDPIPLPLTNENLSRWRDRRRVEFAVDFSPRDIAQSRIREQRLFYDRFDNYEQ